MYKKILGGIAIVAIAVVAAINFSVNTKNSGLSDISLANVETLAQGEIIVEALCMIGPDDFCIYPPFPGYPYWDIIYPGRTYN